MQSSLSQFWEPAELPIATQHWGKLAHFPVIMTCSLMGPIQEIMTTNKTHPTYLLGPPSFTVFSHTASADLNNWTKRNNSQPSCPYNISKEWAVVSQHSGWCWHGIYSGLLQDAKYANKQNKHNLLEQLDLLMVSKFWYHNHSSKLCTL